MSKKSLQGSLLFLLVLSFALFVGCGETSEKTDSAKPTSQGKPRVDPPKIPTEVPQPGVTSGEAQTRTEIIKATEMFLSAIRSGQDSQVFAMMSPIARTVCDREKIPSLPASDTARFTVDEVEMFAVDGAYVRTTMTETDEQGNSIADSLVWALRKTEEGWKIAGVAFTLFTNFDPIVVDFESKEGIEAAERQSLEQQRIYMAALQKAQAERDSSNQNSPNLNSSNQMNRPDNGVRNSETMPPIGNSQSQVPRQ